MADNGRYHVTNRIIERIDALGTEPPDGRVSRAFICSGSSSLVTGEIRAGNNKNSNGLDEGRKHLYR